MVKFVLTDAITMYDGVDISGDLHTVGLEYTADLQDCTAFGDGARRRLAGLLDVKASHQGWWDHVDEVGPPIDSLDKELFEKIGAASGLMSMSPDGGQGGEVGFSFTPQESVYSPGAVVGEIFAFNLECMGDGPLIRGTVMDKAVFATTTNGVARQLGASLITETIYSTIHVTAASGSTPTLDVTIESDNDMGMAGATTRLTHPEITGVGANQQTLVAAIMDDWWRMVFTIGGGTPSFTIFGIIGIQKTITP